MPNNTEVKARLHNWDSQIKAARSLQTEPETILEQTDTFFVSATGRLKLREFPTGPAELIYYERPDTRESKQSFYQIYRTNDPCQLTALLKSMHGIRGQVVKTRTLIMVGQTRVHFDRVQGLGEFLELEVVLRPEQAAAAGELIAADLMKQLDVRNQDLIDCAYIDLLEQHAS